MFLDSKVVRTVNDRWWAINEEWDDKGYEWQYKRFIGEYSWYHSSFV